MKTLTDVRNFLNEIPDEKWCMNSFENAQGQRCALGHINHALCGNAVPSLQDCSEGTYGPSISLLPSASFALTVVKANNGHYTSAKGNTPRERVVNLIDEELKKKNT